jgi:hypothetical protein
MREDSDRDVANAGRDAEQNHAVLCVKFRQLLASAAIAASRLAS